MRTANISDQSRTSAAAATKKDQILIYPESLDKQNNTLKILVKKTYNERTKTEYYSADLFSDGKIKNSITIEKPNNLFGQNYTYFSFTSLSKLSNEIEGNACEAFYNKESKNKNSLLNTKTTFEIKFIESNERLSDFSKAIIAKNKTGKDNLIATKQSNNDTTNTSAANPTSTTTDQLTSDATNTSANDINSASAHTTTTTTAATNNPAANADSNPKLAIHIQSDNNDYKFEFKLNSKKHHLRFYKKENKFDIVEAESNKTDFDFKNTINFNQEDKANFKKLLKTHSLDADSFTDQQIDFFYPFQVRDGVKDELKAFLKKGAETANTQPATNQITIKFEDLKKDYKTKKKLFETSANQVGLLGRIFSTRRIKVAIDDGGQLKEAQKEEARQALIEYKNKLKEENSKKVKEAEKELKNKITLESQKLNKYNEIKNSKQFTDAEKEKNKAEALVEEAEKLYEIRQKQYDDFNRESPGENNENYSKPLENIYEKKEAYKKNFEEKKSSYAAESKKLKAAKKEADIATNKIAEYKQNLKVIKSKFAEEELSLEKDLLSLVVGDEETNQNVKIKKKEKELDLNLAKAEEASIIKLLPQYAETIKKLISEKNSLNQQKTLETEPSDNGKSDYATAIRNAERKLGKQASEFTKYLKNIGVKEKNVEENLSKLVEQALEIKKLKDEKDKKTKELESAKKELEKAEAKISLAGYEYEELIANQNQGDSTEDKSGGTETAKEKIEAAKKAAEKEIEATKKDAEKKIEAAKKAAEEEIEAAKKAAEEEIEAAKVAKEATEKEIEAAKKAAEAAKKAAKEATEKEIEAAKEAAKKAAEAAEAAKEAAKVAKEAAENAEAAKEALEKKIKDELFKQYTDKNLSVEDKLLLAAIELKLAEEKLSLAQKELGEKNKELELKEYIVGSEVVISCKSLKDSDKVDEARAAIYQDSFLGRISQFANVFLSQIFTNSSTVKNKKSTKLSDEKKPDSANANDATKPKNAAPTNKKVSFANLISSDILPYKEPSVDANNISNSKETCGSVKFSTETVLATKTNLATKTKVKYDDNESETSDTDTESDFDGSQPSSRPEPKQWFQLTETQNKHPITKIDTNYVGIWKAYSIKSSAMLPGIYNNDGYPDADKKAINKVYKAKADVLMAVADDNKLSKDQMLKLMKFYSKKGGGTHEFIKFRGGKAVFEKSEDNKYKSICDETELEIAQIKKVSADIQRMHARIGLFNPERSNIDIFRLNDHRDDYRRKTALRSTFVEDEVLNMFEDNFDQANIDKVKENIEKLEKNVNKKIQKTINALDAKNSTRGRHT